MRMREGRELPDIDLTAVQEAEAAVRREAEQLKELRDKAKHTRQIIQVALRTRNESHVILKEVSKIQAELEVCSAPDQPQHPGCQASVEGAIAERLAVRSPRA